MNLPAREALLNIIVNHYNKKVFTAGNVSVAGLTPFSSDALFVSYGYTDDFSHKAVTENSFFDLASLTKPLVTVLSLLYLFDHHQVTWNDTIGSIFKRNLKRPFADITIDSLLKHTSGLPDHYRFYEELPKSAHLADKRDFLLGRMAELPLSPSTHGAPVYSDLGYMVLGLLVEAATMMPLDTFWREHIARPLGLETCLFYPVPVDPYQTDFVSTKPIEGGGVLTGVVHDDNCRSLGGICGHAGLFGNAQGVLSICKQLLDRLKGRHSLLPIERHTLFRALMKQQAGDWTAGFQTPSRYESSSGSLFSDESFGHLGYTGTSFWIDPKRDLIVVLLTNRVYMGDKKDGIKVMRPELHNLVGKLYAMKEQ